MNTWVLDDGPFGVLARHVDPGWRWPSATLHVVHDVALAASEDKSKRRQKLLDMRSESGAPCITVHEIMAGTPEFRLLYGYMRANTPRSDNDLGEHASIALCAVVQQEGIFVTQDAGAALLGLSELGRGRVACPFDLWDDLERRGLISLATFRALCESTYRSSKELWPGIPARLRR